MLNDGFKFKYWLNLVVFQHIYLLASDYILHYSSFAFCCDVQDVRQETDNTMLSTIQAAFDAWSEIHKPAVDPENLQHYKFIKLKYDAILFTWMKLYLLRLFKQKVICIILKLVMWTWIISNGSSKLPLRVAYNSEAVCHLFHPWLSHINCWFTAILTSRWDEWIISSA